MARFDTLSLHAGQHPDPSTGSRTVPVHRTAAFAFGDAEHAAQLFGLERAGHIHSRLSNPTVAVLEERVAALEGGIGAVCAASGAAALTLAISTLMGQGGHIVAATSMRAGNGLLTGTLARFGIATTFVSPRDLDGFRSAVRPETRLMMAEPVGLHGQEVLDIAALAAIAHGAGVPLLIDNTVTTPFLCRPLALGADLVVHSLTGWMGGHGVAVGGAVVDGGRFDWRAGAGYPVLAGPDRRLGGMSFDEQFGPAAFLLRARLDGLGDLGACLAPADAFLLLQGVETLGLRMQRHMANTLAVLDFLAGHEFVTWVRHPARPEHPDHRLAARVLPNGAGCVVGFGVAGGAGAAYRLIDACRLVSRVADGGEAKSSIIHPASTTHRHMDAGERATLGVGEDLVALSVGIEDPADILADLGQALRASQKN